MYRRVFWIGEFKKMLFAFSGCKVSWQRNQMYAKIKQNCTDFSSVQDMEAILRAILKFCVRVSEFKYTT